MSAFSDKGAYGSGRPKCWPVFEYNSAAANSFVWVCLVKSIKSIPRMKSEELGARK